MHDMDWDIGPVQETICLAGPLDHGGSPHIMEIGNGKWMVKAKLRTTPAKEDPFCLKYFNWDTIEMNRGKQYKNDGGEFAEIN